MKKKLIAFIPDFEKSKQIVIAKGKTMEEAIKFSKERFGFNLECMEKVEESENVRIGVINFVQ